MRGPPAERLAVGLAGESHVLRSDRRERDKLDRVNLDLTEADAVPAARLYPGPLPEPNRERNVAGEDIAPVIRG